MVIDAVERHWPPGTGCRRDLWNRLLYLSLSVLLVYAACVCSVGSRLMRPASSAGSGRPPSSAPCCGPPSAAARADRHPLWLMVWNGPEGEPAKAKLKDYWRQNMRTWTDAPYPRCNTSYWTSIYTRKTPLPCGRGLSPAESARQADASDHAHGRPRLAKRTLDAQREGVRPDDRSRLLVFSLPDRCSRRSRSPSAFSTTASFRRESPSRAVRRRSSFFRRVSC